MKKTINLKTLLDELKVISKEFHGVDGKHCVAEVAASCSENREDDTVVRGYIEGIGWLFKDTNEDLLVSMRRLAYETKNGKNLIENVEVEVSDEIDNN